MTKSRIAEVGAVGIAALFLTGALSAHAQSGSPKPAAATPTPPATPIGRTPDGQPDIRGIWNKVGGGINESTGPDARFVTECRAFFGQNAEPTGFDNTEPRPKPQYEPPARPQGIVDPADRVLPWRPEAVARRSDFVVKMGPPAYSLEHIEKTARCVPPGPWQGGITQILQRPGAVVLLYENDHASRVIHLDGRPPLGSTFTSFMGESIGRWEGNTLVVRTTNLNGQGYWGRTLQYYSPSMRLEERFIVLAKDRIDYEIVYDDPELLTRPIKSVGYFFPADDGYELREVTCVEGAYTLRNIFGF